MKYLSMKTLNVLALVSLFAFCNYANAEHFTVDSSNSYPYKNLIERTDAVKIFYTKSYAGFSCKVEVALDNMKWISTENKVSTDTFYNDPLANCLSPDNAKQILFQTFLEFGRGL